jgi:hypothetical protein
MDTNKYLEYLDKEMTIMGILSAVCVAAPAGILNAVLSKDSDVKSMFWNPGHFFIVMGSALCILSALMFYKERSSLAWYYGQICLAEELEGKKSVSSKLREWLQEADSWEAWWPYSWGFAFLIAGITEYLLAMFFLLVPPYWPWLLTHLHTIKILTLFVCPVVAGGVAAAQWYAMTHHKFSDNYWADFREDIFKYLRREKTLPHDGVYTRLKASRAHGVGVFAIVDIPEGTYMFEPDDDDLVSVSADETKGLPPALRKLYEDFCVLNDGTYQCPSNLNKLTPAWFLNTSKEPNVAANLSLKFYALRDIKAGDELTADYDTYSEHELDEQVERN